MVRLTLKMMTATIRAATVSAWFTMCLTWGGRFRKSASHTARTPTKTVAEARISVAKCRASAASAWLLACFAAFLSTRTRLMSTAMDTAMTATPQSEGMTGEE